MEEANNAAATHVDRGDDQHRPRQVRTGTVHPATKFA
jgi:hypothetical protein